MRLQTDKQDDYIQRDLLATFTSVEHCISHELTEQDIDRLYRIFLMRLSTLCFYHGDQCPETWLQALQHTTSLNAITLTNHFLEIGHANPTHDEQMMIAKKELQQELLHTSRIADTEFSRAPSSTIHNRGL